MHAQFCRSARAALIGLAFASTALAAPAWAMRVSPMVNEIGTKGAGSAARIEVQNFGSVALPFETRITEINFSAKGEVVETAADDQFLVFPPQGLVPVGGRQVVRAQWVGDQDLKASRAFYLSVRQLPVAIDQGDGNAAGAQVQVVYHMKALITVAPAGSEPKVEVVEATPTMVSVAPADVETPGAPKAAPKPVEKVPGIHVKVRNTGTRYALMSGPNWIVEGKAPDGSPLKIKVPAEKISQAVGVGYLPPAGGERVFDVPTDAAFGPGPIQVRFEK
jgi:fimbrial chaperone protein